VRKIIKALKDKLVRSAIRNFRSKTIPEVLAPFDLGNSIYESCSITWISREQKTTQKKKKKSPLLASRFPRARRQVIRHVLYSFVHLDIRFHVRRGGEARFAWRGWTAKISCPATLAQSSLHPDAVYLSRFRCSRSGARTNSIITRLPGTAPSIRSSNVEFYRRRLEKVIIHLHAKKSFEQPNTVARRDACRLPRMHALKAGGLNMKPPDFATSGRIASYGLWHGASREGRRIFDRATCEHSNRSRKYASDFRHRTPPMPPETLVFFPPSAIARNGG